MSKSIKQVLCAAAAVLAMIATPAFAQTAAPSATATSGYTADGWGNIGFTVFHENVDFCVGGVCGSASGSTTEFGIHAGGDFGMRLSESLSAVGIADLAVNFGDQTIVPFLVGAGVKLDHTLPVTITAGLGFTVLTGISGVTPLGLGILAQAYYPLPSMPQLGVGGQIQIHILNNGFTDFGFNAGVEYSFM